MTTLDRVLRRARLDISRYCFLFYLPRSSRTSTSSPTLLLNLCAIHDNSLTTTIHRLLIELNFSVSYSKIQSYPIRNYPLLVPTAAQDHSYLTYID